MTKISGSPTQTQGRQNCEAPKGWKKGWKVLKPDRLSLFVAEYLGGVHYKKGENVEPKSNCGPLAIFSDQDHAKNFLDQHHPRGGAIIVPVLFLPSKKEGLRDNKGYVLHRRDLPSGTELADAVICLE